MEISFLGHSSFRIKTKNATLVIDPFDPKMVGIKFPPIDADIVTVSHQHKDHNNTSLVKGATKVIEGPGEYEIKDVSIMGFPTFHDKKEGEERGSNIIYVYEAEGLRLAHLGDLGHKLSEDLIEELGEIHILMIPVGGTVSLSAEEATEVVRSIEPNIIIPMHYQEEGLNQEEFAKLTTVEEFVKEIGVNHETLPKLIVKDVDIGEDSKVVVLERK
jgi:L-ascorbate metabolism protein UlaG (beta-lactamase superfamily)